MTKEIGRESKEEMKEKDEIKGEKVIIIGGGPAGLTAAIYLARAGLDTSVLIGPEPGGRITTTSSLENYPGFPESVGGFEYIQKVLKQAEQFGAKLKYETVEKVNFEEKPYQVVTATNNYKSSRIIIATGSLAKKLGLEKEKDFVGKGISYCATCDGALFKNKKVAVVGGGNVALEEANFLTRFASKVYLIHRRDEFRGVKILQDRVFNNSDIEILWNSEVRKILGKNQVEGLLIENKEKQVKEKIKDIRGLFIAIGYKPKTELFRDYLELNDKGYIVTNNKQETSKEGIYAAGDVQDSEYRQVVTASASGAKAAMEITKNL